MTTRYRIVALVSLTLLLVVNVVLGIYFKSLDINKVLYNEVKNETISQINYDSSNQKLDGYQMFEEIEENEIKSKKSCKTFDLYFKIEFLQKKLKQHTIYKQFYNSLYRSLDLLEIIPPPPRF